MPVKPELRMDARRNRAAIIEAARTLFAARGLSVPTDEIARRAGVGNATLYRRFPAREDLVEAVFAERVGELIDAAERALEVDDPWLALSGFVHELCSVQARDRGLADFLALNPSSERLAALTDNAYARTENLVERARAAGVLRPELQMTDIATLLMANAGLVERAGDAAAAASERFVGITLDGWRAAACVTPAPRGPSREALRAALRNESG